MGASFAKHCMTPDVVDDTPSTNNVEVTSVDVAVFKLKRTRARLEAQCARIQLDIDRAHADALENKSSPTLAKRHIRSKRMHEAFKRRLEGWIMNLDASLVEIDSAQATSDVLVALRAGNDALKFVTDTCSDVDEIMGDLQRIGHWFARVGEDVPVTTEDVQAEYDALVLEEQRVDDGAPLASEATSVDTALNLPSVPARARTEASMTDKVLVSS